MYSMMKNTLPMIDSYATQTESIAELEAAIDWLPANLPEDDGRVALVHGDYRLSQVTVEPAVIEFEPIH